MAWRKNIRSPGSSTFSFLVGAVHCLNAPCLLLPDGGCPMGACTVRCNCTLHIPRPKHWQYRPFSNVHVDYSNLFHRQCEDADLLVELGYQLSLSGAFDSAVEAYQAGARANEGDVRAIAGVVYCQVRGVCFRGHSGTCVIFLSGWTVRGCRALFEHCHLDPAYMQQLREVPQFEFQFKQCVCGGGCCTYVAMPLVPGATRTLFVLWLALSRVENQLLPPSYVGFATYPDGCKRRLLYSALPLSGCWSPTRCNAASIQCVR